MKRIMFVCKFNRFRSQIAAGLFEKYAGKGFKVVSAGVILGNPISKEVRKVARERGVRLTKPEGLVRSILNKQDIIVIVANDVPVGIFKTLKNAGRRVILWKVPDIHESVKKDLEYTVDYIEKKVKKLVKQLR